MSGMVTYALARSELGQATCPPLCIMLLEEQEKSTIRI